MLSCAVTGSVSRSPRSRRFREDFQKNTTKLRFQEAEPLKTPANFNSSRLAEDRRKCELMLTC